MPKKKKKTWKEQQRDRQLKERKVEKTFQQQRQHAKKNKPRKWPKGKIVVSLIILSIVISSYAYFTLQNPTIPFSNIHITSDGLIDPSTAPILRTAENYYTLTADIHGSIIIEKDNMILDGANHILSGNNEVTSKGIEIIEKNQITIKNLEITNFESGIHIFLSSNNIISQNTLSDNEYSVWLEYSSNNEIIKLLINMV
jgi:parallel beta-helix repeat protein